MKKAISLFLVLIMMISMAILAFAAESSEEYYTIQVEYSDNTGHQEPFLYYFRGERWESV